MTSPGLTLTGDGVLDADATVELIDIPISDVSTAITSQDSFQDALLDALGEAATDLSNRELIERLDDAGVIALDGTYADTAVRAAVGETEAAWDLLRITRQLGHNTSLDIRTGIDDLLGSYPAVFAALDATPLIEIRLTRAFLDQDLRTGRDVCRLLAALAQGCDVRVTGSWLAHRTLADRYHRDLPGCVSEQLNTRRPAPPDGVVDDALDAYDPDGIHVAILRALADEPAGNCSYQQLYAEIPRSESRIRQAIGAGEEALEALGLVERFGPRGDTCVELRQAGREVFDTLDEQIARQRRLESFVSDPGNPSIYCRDTTRTGRPPSAPPDPADRRQLGDAVTVARLSPSQQAAIAGPGDPASGSITLVDHPVAVADDLRTPHWGYDPDRDRVVVAGEATNPLQYWVCLARALASYETFDQVLTAARLDGDEDEDDPFSGLAVEDPRLLRNARNLGYLADDVVDGEDYREELLAAREHLEELTTRYHNGEYDDRDAFRSAITTDAQGLAGTIVHLLDLAGVDVVLGAFCPEFTRRYDADRRQALANTLAHNASIHSTYGEFLAYRQHYEQRSAKREAAITPDVDAADPYGELIDSFVIMGPGIEAFEDDLDAAFDDLDHQLHEDAPEFSVEIPITATDRSAFVRTATEILDHKNLTVTREAISLLQALVGSPLDAAEALNYLSTEDERREIRIDECRYALAQLDADRILPDAPPSASKMVAALLTADRPLSKAALAERAGISPKSVYNNRDALEALGLLRVDGEGYRLALSFTTDEERRNHDPIMPWPIEDDALLQDVLWDVAVAVIDDAEASRISDPEDPVGQCFCSPRPDPWRLRTVPDLAPWVDVAAALANDHPPDPRTEISTVARMGPEIEQAALSLREAPA